MKIRKEILLGFIALASFFICYKIGYNQKCEQQNSKPKINNNEVVKMDSLGTEGHD